MTVIFLGLIMLIIITDNHSSGQRRSTQLLSYFTLWQKLGETHSLAIQPNWTLAQKKRKRCLSTYGDQQLFYKCLYNISWKTVCLQIRAKYITKKVKCRGGVSVHSLNKVGNKVTFSLWLALIQHCHSMYQGPGCASLRTPYILQEEHWKYLSTFMVKTKRHWVSVK